MADFNDVSNKSQEQIIKTVTAVVLSGQTVSSKIDLWGTRAVTIAVPVGLTSIALTFQVSDDDVTYYPVRYADNSAFTITVSNTAAAYALPVNMFAGWRHLKAVCGSPEPADRTFKFIPYLV